MLLDLAATAEAIAAVQAEDGSIPHWPGHHADPWNHTEALMGLDIVGMHLEARRGYRWLAAKQRPDGAWHAGYMGDVITDPTLDANFCAYVATGVWHHYLITGDAAFLDEMWPVVERAVEFVLGLQTETGHILWARDERYAPWPSPLLTSCTCIHLSLRCAIAICETIGLERPEWELALTCLRDAIVGSPEVFANKRRFSMDWYYPVLTGVITGDEARSRIFDQWETFVIEGHGCRCVSDRPWVTTGETAELILALDVCGLRDESHLMFEWLQKLRSEDGDYWMGATFPDGTIWPRQKPTWGSGSVVLAADALANSTAASGLFRGETFEVLDSPVSDPL